MSKDESLLAQWQTCVEMANSVSQRRDTMNNVFVTLNLAIIAAVSVAWDRRSLLLLIAGVGACVLWTTFIKNYKLLNAAKFDIINEIERELPRQPFNDEWDKLKSNPEYKDGTELERWLPRALILSYIAIAVVILVIK